MSITNLIEEAGVVGCGGAGFPTHKKLCGQMEYLIINAAECEPLLRTDRYLMLHHAPQIVEALQVICSELSVGKCVIAVKHHYEEEITSLRKAIEQQNASVEIHELESFYPAGDEQTIVYEVTGRVVPPAGIPANVGAVVSNIGTIDAVYHAIHGEAFTQKILTVTGEVQHPTILSVPVGTSMRECVELAGGATVSNFFAVNGGPMMGRVIRPQDFDTAVVTKTTSGILVLSPEGRHAQKSAVDIKRMLAQARSACIQCSFCTQLCPRHLLGHPIEPHRIMRAMAAGGDLESLLQNPVIQSAQLCCECGVCEVCACPMGLMPRTINSMLKKELGKNKIRYKASQTEFVPSPEREYRKVPSKKAAARAGVLPYYDYEIKEFATYAPQRVEIPLSMHIGAPAVPTVQVGDCVNVGELIADIPQGALGAKIHASIAGRVEAISDRIVIVKQ